MPPTDNSDPEDFVFVDDPVHVASLKDVPIRVGTRKSPIEPDYVTVDVHNPIASAKPRVLADDHKQPMLHIEYFAPIPLGKIPQQITQVVLMAPAPTEDHVVEDEVSAPPSSHALLIKNVSMIFECFFHFQDVYAKIGRDSILYMVGKACELKAEGSSALRQHVGCILDTLREARVAFLRANKGKLILKSGDLSASELAKLVDRYISFTPEEPEPRSVSKKWYKDPAVEALWLGWKEVLVSKGLRMPKVRRDTATVQATDSRLSKQVHLVSETMRTAGLLDSFLVRLEALGPTELDGIEKLLLWQALDGVTCRIDQIKRQQ